VSLMGHMGNSDNWEKRAGYRAIGRFGVLVHPEGEMNNGDWDEIMRLTKAHLPNLQMLIVWADGTLTPMQRSSVLQQQLEGAFQVLTFTDSAPTRGVMKVLQWFGLNAQVLPKHQVVIGLEKAGLSPEESRNIRVAIRELERELNCGAISSSHIAIKPNSRAS